MENETNNLLTNDAESVEVLQLTLQEESYCQYRAEGMTKRAAWKSAFGISDISDATLDSRVNRLEHRIEIAARIAEIRRDVVEANQAKWEKRREEMLELLYNGARRVAGDPELGGLAAASKAIGQLSNMLGWNEPQRLEVAACATGIQRKDVDAKIERLLALTGAASDGGESAITIRA